MTRGGDNQDRKIIERLRADVDKLEALEKHIKTLEDERNKLLESNNQLSEKLNELRLVKDEWEWFFENSTEMLCIAGVDGCFKRVNPAFARNLVYTPEYLTSRPFIDFVHPDDVELTLKELDRLVTGNDCINFENRYRDSEGNWHWLSWHCPAVSPSITKLYAIARDITERKRYTDQILYKALHDSLTDLFNRSAFEDKLLNAIPRLKRDTDRKIALYLIDLDGFKKVNDSYGHPAGDILLKLLAKRFKQIQRAGEMVCRLGGDEFAFIIEGMGEIEIEPLAKRIMEAACQSFELDKSVTVNVGCSIGISTFPNSATDSNTLVSQADIALYSVKKSEKGGYKIFNKKSMGSKGAELMGSISVDSI